MEPGNEAGQWSLGMRLVKVFYCESKVVKCFFTAPPLGRPAFG